MMDTRKLVMVGALAMAGLAMAVPRLDAQERRVSLHVRGGFNFPGGSLEYGIEPLEDRTAEAGGASFGGDLVVRLGGPLSIYGGYTRAQFDCGGDTCGDATYHSDGFGAGVRLARAMPGGFAPWLRVGALYQSTRFEQLDVEVESDEALGFEAGVGLEIPLGEMVSVVPAVRYYRYDAEWSTLPEGIERTVSWTQADVGLRIGLF